MKYKDTNENLIPAYAKIVSQTPITHNPDKLIELLIGEEFNQTDIDSLAEEYIKRANDNGSRDNITVVVMKG